jgi:hypothetical protein
VSDPADIWCEIQARWADYCAVMHEPDGRLRMMPFEPVDLPARARLILKRIFCPAQLMVEKDFLGEWCWNLHPRIDVASRKSWGYVCAVMQGHAVAMHELADNKYDAPEIYRLVADYRARAYGMDIGYMASTESLLGEDIVDLVAFSADLRKCYGALARVTAVVGYPVYPDMETRRIRVFKSVLGWIESGCAGAVLVGDARDNYQWLQACEGGIVCDDVAHGKAVQQFLRRPYEGPPVLVAA